MGQSVTRWCLDTASVLQTLQSLHKHKTEDTYHRLLAVGRSQAAMETQDKCIRPH